MPKFNVHLVRTVSTTITVEADDVGSAIDLAYESDEMPGSMTHQAFGDASVDEAGEWEAIEVTDENGEVVWTDGNQ